MQDYLISGNFSESKQHYTKHLLSEIILKKKKSGPFPLALHALCFIINPAHDLLNLWDLIWVSFSGLARFFIINFNLVMTENFLYIVPNTKDTSELISILTLND